MTDQLINALIDGQMRSVFDNGAIARTPGHLSLAQIYAQQARRAKPRLRRCGTYWQCGTETVAAFAPTPREAYLVWLGGEA